MNAFQRTLHGDDLLWFGDLSHLVVVFPAHLSAGENRFFLGAVGIAHAHLHEKSIHLSLRQGVGSFLLDGVLSGQHHERCWKLVGDAFDGHLLFFHGFKQGRLRLGWRTVDLVGKEDVGEQWPGPEFEVPGLLVVHVGPHDVRGQQVRRELNTLELAAEGPSKGVREQRLCEAGEVLEQHVAVGKNADADASKVLLLSDDDFADLAHEVVRNLRNGADDFRGVRIGGLHLITYSLC